MVLVLKESKCLPRKGQTFLYVENPSLDIAKICRSIEFDLFPKQNPGIHPSAYVHPSAQVSDDAYIGPLCCIEEGAKIGATYLTSQVTVSRCHLKRWIHNFSASGYRALLYYWTRNRYMKDV